MIKFEEPGGHVMWMSEKAYDDMVKEMLNGVIKDKIYDNNNDNNAETGVLSTSTNKTNETRRERRRNKRNSLR